MRQKYPEVDYSCYQKLYEKFNTSLHDCTATLLFFFAKMHYQSLKVCKY